MSEFSSQWSVVSNQGASVFTAACNISKNSLTPLHFSKAVIPLNDGVYWKCEAFPINKCREASTPLPSPKHLFSSQATEGKKKLNKILLLILCILLSACTQKPVDIKNHEKVYSSAKYSNKSSLNIAQKKRQQPTYYSVTVNKGDSLHELAERYSISARDIININKLKPPYQLKIGKKLKLPVTRFYTVKSGDTLYEISREYGVDMSSMVKLNKLSKPYELLAGQRLRLPYQSYATEKISDENQQVASSKKEKITPEIEQESHSAEIDIKPSQKSGKFLWPIRGKIISKFGAKAGGIYNDGINIAAPDGTAIRASNSGTVVYTGNELKGYGNLLIIRHNNGWLTAYAHEKSIKVKRGDKVKKGQIIGLVGSSGKVDRPQLHFAIRRGREAVDPIKYL